MPTLSQLRGGGHGIGVLHLELDAYLRHGPVGGPLVGAEARLRRLSERPDAEMLAAANSLAVEVLTAGVGLERKPQRVEVQLAALRRVGRDHATLEIHSTSMAGSLRPTRALRFAGLSRFFGFDHPLGQLVCKLATARSGC